MKKVTITFLVVLMGFIAHAQKVIEKNLDYKNQYIDVEVAFASTIEVKTWDKSTVYFKADITTEDGKYLDDYELKIRETASRISIETDPGKIFKKFQKEREEKKSNKRGYYVSNDTYKFDYVLYVPKNAKFKIGSINGSLKAETIEGEFEADLINGDIEIAKYSGSLDLNTINGEIDLKIIDAEVVAETIHGDIYADEKLNFAGKDRHVGQKVSGTRGEGSNRLRLNTINGNMYLRL